MHGGIYRCTGIYFFKSAKEYKLPLFLAVHTCCTECNRYVLHCQLSINQFVQHSFLCMIMFRLQAFYT